MHSNPERVKRKERPGSVRYSSLARGPFAFRYVRALQVMVSLPCPLYLCQYLEMWALPNPTPSGPFLAKNNRYSIWNFGIVVSLLDAQP